MNGREEQIDWISGALAGLGVEGHTRDDWAPRLYAQGVRVLGPDEVILDRVDAKLLAHVRQAAERWEEKKAATVTVSADESDDTVDVKGPGEMQRLILFAMNTAGRPMTRVAAIQSAAGWHPAVGREPAEWEPWDAAWRELLISRRIQRANRGNSQELGEMTLWKPAPTPRFEANSPHQLDERRRLHPGRCVVAVMTGPTPAQGAGICGQPEHALGSGACKDHTL